ncbi:MAG: aldo/keto reductase [Dehalococcoidia bacterium]|nr:aldo/keto reductase [Dehalococcoidia bacterium]
MIKRVLGKTGMEVSLLSLGTGGARQLGQTIGHSIYDQKRLVKAALDIGVNIFDTATHYGDSESILGECLSGIPRDSFLICTKWPARDEVNNTIDDHTKLIKSIEKSLERLQTDYIDIMLFHGIMPHEYDLIVESLYPTMERLKYEGKIRSIGFSSRFSEDPGQKGIELGLSKHPELWDVVMLKYGILNQSAAAKILPLARNHNIGVINMAAVRVKLPDPILLEQLISKWKSSGLIDNDSLPTNNPLGWLVKDNVKSVIEAGYKFAAEPSSISTVLTGTASVEHLKMNVESMKEPSLIEDHMDRLKATLSHIIEYA